jgi:hypothetical protein
MIPFSLPGLPTVRGDGQTITMDSLQRSIDDDDKRYLESMNQG